GARKPHGVRIPTIEPAAVVRWPAPVMLFAVYPLLTNHHGVARSIGDLRRANGPRYSSGKLTRGIELHAAEVRWLRKRYTPRRSNDHTIVHPIIGWPAAVPPASS